MEFVVQYLDGEPNIVSNDEQGGMINFVVEDDGLYLLQTNGALSTRDIEKVAKATKELPFVDDVQIE